MAKALSSACATTRAAALLVRVLDAELRERDDENAGGVTHELVNAHAARGRFVHGVRVRSEFMVVTVLVFARLRLRLELVADDFHGTDVNERTGGDALEDGGDGWICAFRRAPDQDPDRGYERKHRHENEERLRIRHAAAQKRAPDAERGRGFVRRDGGENRVHTVSIALKPEGDTRERGVQRDARHEEQSRSRLREDGHATTLLVVRARVARVGRRLVHDDDDGRYCYYCYCRYCNYCSY